jgi:hypothetical protein
VKTKLILPFLQRAITVTLYYSIWDINITWTFCWTCEPKPGAFRFFNLWWHWEVPIDSHQATNTVQPTRIAMNANRRPSAFLRCALIGMICTFSVQELSLCLMKLSFTEFASHTNNYPSRIFRTSKLDGRRRWCRHLEWTVTRDSAYMTRLYSRL